MFGHAEHGRAGLARTDHQLVVADKGHPLADQMQGQGGFAHARKPGHGHAGLANRHARGMGQETAVVQLALDEAIVDEVDDLVRVALAVAVIDGQTLPVPRVYRYACPARVPRCEKCEFCERIAIMDINKNR